MAQTLTRLSCSYCEAEDTDSQTLEEAVENGWYLLEGPDGQWEYCSVECLRSHL